MRVQRSAVLCFLFVVLPFNGAAAADKLVGIHSAISISQSLPWIAREAGIFVSTISISISS
jgi:hypothetical protein